MQSPKFKQFLFSFFSLFLFFIIFFTIPQAFVISIIVYFLFYFAGELGKESYSNLQTITFFYSLAITVTFIVMIWAIVHGDIYDHGHLKSWISKLFEYVFALNNDAVIFLALWGIFFFPQVGSFILSGCVGYAPKIRYIDISLDLFSWSIIKSIVTASGVLITWYFFNLFERWVDLQQSHIALVFSLILLLSTLVWAIFHRIVIKKLIDRIDNNFFKKIIKILRRNMPEQENKKVDNAQLIIDIEDVLNKHQRSFIDLLELIPLELERKQKF